MAIDPKLDKQLRQLIAGFYDDPLGYVMFNFPWTTNKSIQMVKLPKKYRDRYDSEFGPSAWACDFFEEWGQEIKLRGFDGVNAVAPILFSTASGHGIGKSATCAPIIKFIHDTRPFSRGTVTAVTDGQLRNKTWAELAKWHNISLTKHWSRLLTGRGAMALRNLAFPEEWYVQAQTSREENSESFAGQHAANSTSFYLFDEASGIPDKIFEVRQGGLTDGEPMVFDFGNPTRNSGAFYENMEGRNKGRYIRRSIDMRDVEITNKQWAADLIADYGEDSDMVRVRVKGQFPHQSSLQFISGEDVRAAMKRELVADKTAPLVMGVDVAREGDDDSVIYCRIGRDARSFPPIRMSKFDNVQVAQKVMQQVQYFQRLGYECAGLFVDNGGVGGGVIDILRHAGYNPIAVNFGGTPADPAMYATRNDEMWGRVRAALKDGLCLPDGADMKATSSEEDYTLEMQLTKREFDHTLKQQIKLESKRDMRKRGLKSPDVADALALTYALEVAPRANMGAFSGHSSGARVITDDDIAEGFN